MSAPPAEGEHQPLRGKPEAGGAPPLLPDGLKVEGQIKPAFEIRVGVSTDLLGRLWRRLRRREKRREGEDSRPGQAG
jgi:hypothetical protein